MTRVLLVCPERLGHGQPAGIGIRFVEMAKVLAADGHQVTLMSADGGPVDGAEAVAMTPESIAQTTSEHDVAVVQGHAANSLFAHGRAIPTVVDLYDPFLIENLHYSASEIFTHDHATLMNSLARGDFFLCASDAQRLFYLGLMLAVGRVSPASFESDPHFDTLITIAPFGVQPPRPRRDRRVSHQLLFGSIYDWYDPVLAIDAVAIARRSVPDLSLTFTTHPNPDLTPQGKLSEAIAHVKRASHGDFIRFENWVAYEDRGEFYDRFDMALLTFRQSIETDLSMRTRVFDYLWGGLPIITSSAPGTDEILDRYRCGIVVKSDSAEALAAEILSAAPEQMRQGAAQFVDDHQWPRVLAPLREFCKRPRADKQKDAFAVRMQVPERAASILDRLKRRIGGAY